MPRALPVWAAPMRAVSPMSSRRLVVRAPQPLPLRPSVQQMAVLEPCTRSPLAIRPPQSLPRPRVS